MQTKKIKRPGNLFSFLVAVMLTVPVIFPAKKKIRVFLAGDSTMSVKEAKAYPETGWGMPFVYYWDSTVTIDNRAKNGRSTKTFISEGIWQSIVNDLQPGDYVFIQFGHNDESKDKGERYASPGEYTANLQKMIDETKAKKANPVLLTPVSRRRFDKEGKALQTHEVYSALVRKLAAAQSIPLIDLDEKSRTLYQELGVEASKLLFLQLKPGEHPNYPDGKEDNTHFSETGARKIAGLVLEEIRKSVPELAERIVVREGKK